MLTRRQALFGTAGLGLAASLGVPKVVQAMPTMALNEAQKAYLHEITQWLFPVQRFVVKLVYGLELDSKFPPIRGCSSSCLTRIQLRSPFSDRKPIEVTEVEYLRHLHAESRCNISEQHSEYRELVGVFGRRAGQTTLSSLFARFEVFSLQQDPDLRATWGTDERLNVFGVSPSKDDSSLMYNEVDYELRKLVGHRYVHLQPINGTLSTLNFQTDQDRLSHVPGAGRKSSVRVAFKSCIAKGLGGQKRAAVIFDSLAHYQDRGKPADDKIYKALTKDQGLLVKPRVMTLSTPLGASGKLYDLFEGGFESSRHLVLQIPSWEMNPTLPASFLREKAQRDYFWQEFGAEFSHSRYV